jgi:DinB family protein
MDAVALISNRVGAVNANLHVIVDRAREVDWVTPVAPGTSPIGLTLWHVPRTLDWLVNTSLEGRPEVADSPEFSALPDPQTYGFGTGLTPAEASAAAAAVDPDLLLRYADTVHEGVAKWLGSLSAEDLDRPPAAFDERQQSRPAYCTPAALSEVDGLGQLPLGVLLMRPAVSHLLMHCRR